MKGGLKNIALPPQMIVYIVLGFTFLFVVFQLSKRLGLVRTKQDKIADKEKAIQEREEIRAFAELSAMNAFRTDYWKNNSTNELLVNSEAERLAEIIKDAFFYFWAGGDNEAQVYGVLRELKNRVQLSQVSNAYFIKYKEDLLGKLRDKFSDDELLIVKQIVEALPNE